MFFHNFLSFAWLLSVHDCLLLAIYNLNSCTLSSPHTYTHTQSNAHCLSKPVIAARNMPDGSSPNPRSVACLSTIRVVVAIKTISPHWNHARTIVLDKLVSFKCCCDRFQCAKSCFPEAQTLLTLSHYLSQGHLRYSR